MEIIRGNSRDGHNCPNRLLPLLEAMETGHVISSITLNDKYKKKKGCSLIKDFKADTYSVGYAHKEGMPPSDYVEGESNGLMKSFYMDIVIDFEL